MKNKDLEKDNLTGKNHEGPNANSSAHILTATSIIGDKVENAKGEELGKIKDIMIDRRRGIVEYMIIEFGGFLGVGEKYFAVPFSQLILKPGKQIFILDKDKSFLEKAPGFDKNHWPETNGHYAEAKAYWGDFMGPSVSYM